MHKAFINLLRGNIKEARLNAKNIQEGDLLRYFINRGCDIGWSALGVLCVKGKITYRQYIKVRDTYAEQN